MLHEVFPTMTIDENTKIAQRGPIILGLGESWLRRSYSKKLKRANTTSSRMSLASRYLQILRGYEDDDTEKERCYTMYNYLKPSQVDNLVKAALDLCFLQMDDVEDLKSPSNAIKMKYDLQRMTNIKWAYILKNRVLEQK